jgi:UPF0755 protein
VKKKLIWCAVAFSLVGGFFCWSLYHFLTTPGPQLKQPVIVFVPGGTTLWETTQLLVSEGLVTNGRFFSWWARLTGVDRKIKNGEYEFTNSLSPVEILRRLTEGKGLRHTVTITEGMTLKQIVALLAAKGLGSEESFLCLNTDQTFLARWGLPSQGIEGYLYPDTYYFSWLASPEEILGRMIERFYTVLKPDMYRRATALALSVHEVITLASLIEKETGADIERPLVSAVFHNRLRKGIPLQCDPTVIYGLDDFDGNLTREHLQTLTPYNTYLLRGLPPGPIANPGLKSILAALQPASQNYLYFVAKGDGTHEFSSDLATHNRAVQRFQKRQS